MSVRLFLVGVLTLAAGPLGAGERLSMRVSPAFSFAPAYLTVRAMVEANKDNRAIEIVAESIDFYRSSEIQLDGDRAPRTTMFEFRALPGGVYQVRAVLKGSRGQHLAVVYTSVNVIGTGAVGQ
jgi:hypothetical protein